ncbi:MAG: hypothetical protein ACKOFC_00515 [Solirubrobacterales bacterium]
MSDSGTTRRGFLGRTAAAAGALGAGSVLPAGAAAGTGNPAPAFDLAGLPMRQDDPRWARDLMWDRRRVIRAARAGGMSRREAESLLWDYPDGNSIGNEGCQLTCLAMVLHLLGAPRRPAWTPRTLNRAAHAGLFYTLPGLGMNTLYADLVSEVTDGGVQLAVNENYLPGEKPWAPVHCDTAPLIRAYRGLAPGDRAGLVMMVKTGTYDDTMASHYVLLDPNSTQPAGERDAEVLDPAMPAGRSGRWTLSDSAKWITQDPDIRREWRRAGIGETQVGGAWLFARWQWPAGRPALGPLPAAWAAELAA